MQKRHSDPLRYLNEQIQSTQKYVLPYIAQVKPVVRGMQVLEIGCGEAGNLKPFLDAGCICTGVDFSTPKIEKGKAFYATDPNVENITLISEDIYNVKEFEAKFDLIILRDVIEHIHDQDKFLGLMKKLMTPDGIAFFAFPPWQNPFGGHQQVCENKFLSLVPYFHLLPMQLYKFILKIFGESESKIKGLAEIKDTGISLDRFERIVAKNDYKIVRKTLYFINPNYQIKFGLKPRKLWKVLSAIPYFRDFVSTAGYYIVKI
ncbi:MAG: class I SAM-dependent methyltransferase [Paludibacter sp.]|nr:class I SAM-dependent methyltransferase [Paludibacter sp.]